MKSFAFAKPFFIWLTILCLFCVGLFLKVTVVSEKEEEKLHKLVESSPKKIRKMRQRETHELTQQTRFGVTKQIYVNDEGPLRRQIWLTGDRSEIQVLAKKPHMRVIETFHEAKGVVQQELYYLLADGTELVYSEEGKLVRRDKKQLTDLPKILLPETGEFDPETLEPMQRFRYFEAETAVYDFHAHQLLANNIKFWTYTVPGHEIVDAKSLHEPAEAQGTASRMVLYVEGADSNKSFSAEDLKLQFKPSVGL